MPSTFSLICPLATRMPNSVAAETSIPSIPVVGDTIPRSRFAEAINFREQAKLDATTSASTSARFAPASSNAEESGWKTTSCPSPRSRSTISVNMRSERARPTATIRCPVMLVLAGEPAHRLVDAGQSQREHPVVDELADHADRHGAAPVFFRHRVEPYRLRVVVQEPAHPHAAGFIVPALDTAAGPVDLVRAHAGVADHHDLVVRVVGAQHLHRRGLLDMAAPRILPHALVEAVVKIEMHDFLELATRRREQLFAHPDVVFH